MNDPGSSIALARRPLRMAIALDSLSVPAWVARCLDRVLERSFVSPVLVILVTSAPRRRRGLLFELYARIDARAFAPGADAFAPTDVSDALASVPTLHAGTPGGVLDAAGVQRLRHADLDVILALGEGTWPHALRDCARFGVWSYYHADTGAYGGDPPFFWEIYDGTPVSGITLLAYADAPAGERVLWRSFSATDQTSLHRSRNGPYWTAAEFMSRALAALHARGSSYLDAQPVARAGAMPAPARDAPNNAQMLRFLVMRAAGVVGRRARRALVDERWYVGFRRIDDGGARISQLLAQRRTRRERGWHLLDSPPGHYYADPFLAAHDGVEHLFFEDFDGARGRGMISWVTIDEDGSASQAQVALERPYHLSYPFVFRWRDAWYMVPETAENHTVELYRAVEFPQRWELERVLIADVRAFDATLFEHDGRWWMFANVAMPGGTIADELFLFFADSPTGPWSAHPSNPVVSDVRRSRPAGRVFEHEGALIRPAQDSSRRYGYATVFHRIERLTTSDYAEVPVARIDPSWLRRNLATHTFNCDGGHEVRDAFRWGRRRRGGAGEA